MAGRGLTVPLPLLRQHPWDDQATEWHHPSYIPMPHSHIIAEDQSEARKDKLAKHIGRWHWPKQEEIKNEQVDSGNGDGG